MQRSALFVLTFFLLVALLTALWPADIASADPDAPAAGAPGIVSYQGQVTVGGVAPTGTGYFKFAIVNVTGNTTYWSNDGTSVNGGEPTAAVPLQVTNGLFNVLLGNTTLPGMTQPVTADVFSGVIRYLRVWFSTAAGGPFTRLDPDRRIAAVPYALQAEEVKNAWSLIGNAGTTPGTNFLGTTDNTALQLHVNGVRALRIEPNASSPNLVGGYSGNAVTSGVAGATIGGGGASGNIHRVTDDWGTVGGGYGNIAGDNTGTTSDRSYATVGGGMDNLATGAYSFIGGGTGNRATALQATVAGGGGNTASHDSATVSGGASNTADGFAATVAGGVSNRAGGNYSFAAGFRAKAIHNGAFVWADATNADFNSSANNQFAVRANGGVRLETGGAPVQVNGNTVWHAGNDGSGSTLDADLLDNQHGDYYRVFMVSSGSSATTVITSTCRNYTDGQITITAPRSGTVVVEANVRMQLTHLNGTKDMLVLNLDTTATTCLSSNYDVVYWTIPASYPSSGPDDYTFTVRRAFTVSAAGTYTYYLNGIMGYGGAGDDQFWYARLHATFYPGSVVLQTSAPEKGDAP